MNNQRNGKRFTKEDVFEIVRDSVVSIIECEKSNLNLQTNFDEDLYADSLDRVNLIVAYEDAFKMTIPASMARELRTISQTVDYIMQRCCDEQSA